MSNPAPHDPLLAASMREMSRAHIADTWRRGRKGEPLSQEDVAFYRAMLDHPEYVDFWEHAAELGDKEINADGVNPFLHISLHSVLERQIEDQDPPETAQALFRLTRGGLDRHEALHCIASVLAEFMQQVVHQANPPGLDVYRRRLRMLQP